METDKKKALRVTLIGWAIVIGFGVLYCYWQHLIEPTDVIFVLLGLGFLGSAFTGYLRDFFAGGEDFNTVHFWKLLAALAVYGMWYYHVELEDVRRCVDLRLPSNQCHTIMHDWDRQDNRGEPSPP